MDSTGGMAPSRKKKNAAHRLRFFLSSFVCSRIAAFFRLFLDEHHRVELGTVFPGELVLWTKNAEER